MKRPLLILIFLLALSQLVAAQALFTVSEKAFLKYVNKKFETAQINVKRSSANERYYFIEKGYALLAYAYVGRVNSCRSGGCSVNSNSASGMEYFDYYAIFDIDYRITKLSIFNYQATHGQAVCAKYWLKQFVNYDGSKELKVGRDIDGISGATISTHAFTDNIQFVINALKKIK